MEKLKGLLKSRKFWALVAALVAATAGAWTGTMTPNDALMTAVAALSAYMLGTGLDDSGPKAQG